MKLLDTNLIRKFIFALIIFSLILRLFVLYARHIDPDEFQHLHSIRSIHKGLVIYRDYFEHHTPLLYFLFAPFYTFLGDNISTIFILRFIMMLFTLLVLFITYRLGRYLYESRIALYAVFFLSYVIMALNVTIEIRADMLAASFCLLALIFFIKAVRYKDMIKKTINTYFFLSGIMISIAVLFTQKSLFAAMGLFLAFIWMFFDRRLNISFKKLISSLFSFGIGFSIPFLMIASYFIYNKSFYEFIYYNFILSAKWGIKFWPYANIKLLLKQNPFFSIFGFTGLIIATYNLRQKKAILNGDFVPIISTYSLIAGLFIIPVPHRQYFLLFLPILAIYCGYAFNIITEHLSWSQVQKLWQKRSYLLMSFISLSILVASFLFIYIIIYAKISILISRQMRFFHLWIWLFIIIYLIWGSIKNIKKEYLIISLLLGIIIYPLDQMFTLFLDIKPSNAGKQYIQFKKENQDQLDEIKFILQNTTPEDIVLNGVSDVGVFRNHAYYYQIRQDIKKIMGTRIKDIMYILRNKNPKIIIYKDNLRILSPEIMRYIGTHYKYTGIGDIYILK